MSRKKVRYVRIPSKVWAGIVSLVSHCEAGGEEDMEVDSEDPEGAVVWANIEAACRWVRTQQDKEDPEPS